MLAMKEVTGIEFRLLPLAEIPCSGLSLMGNTLDNQPFFKPLYYPKLYVTKRRAVGPGLRGTAIIDALNHLQRTCVILMQLSDAALAANE
jgi:hypothetical protein